MQVPRQVEVLARLFIEEPFDEDEASEVQKSSGVGSLALTQLVQTEAIITGLGQLIGRLQRRFFHTSCLERYYIEYG